MHTQSLSPRQFMMKILNGSSAGIVIGLVPPAIAGEVFRALAPLSPLFAALYHVVLPIQFSVPALIGTLVGLQFHCSAPEVATLAFVSVIASGNVTLQNGAWLITGIGDVINVMLISALAIILVRALRGKLGSLTIIALPVIVAVVAGGVGSFSLPYVKMITLFVGRVIATFIALQPLLMSILLSMSFSLIIISPVSSVAVGIAVGLTGLASGAANIGVSSCAMTLIVGTMRVNKIGVPLAMFAGAMKMLMPNWIRYPILNIPLLLNGLVCGVLAWLFNLQGTPASAGFGFIGLVGPINAYRLMAYTPMVRAGILFLVYFVLSFLAAYLIDFILVDRLKLYRRELFIPEQG
ncbi:membrane protein [Treponema pallidum subsp. pallidum]|uniref:PTS transporter subunit IIC n=1 Tax=Treponema pallidum TaxID=160 RepID=UPI0007DE28D8|nr:PTS transporter subunit IIC [Treponema pallidum]ANI47887.1 membrane protein [Treponema pallidum subsp. pallidum]